MNKGHLEAIGELNAYTTLRGQLPDGSYDVLVDQEVPFTDHELINREAFILHLKDLDRRVDAKMG